MQNQSFCNRLQQGEQAYLPAFMGGALPGHRQVIPQGQLAQRMSCRSTTQTYIWRACRSIPQLYSVVEA